HQRPAPKSTEPSMMPTLTARVGTGSAAPPLDAGTRSQRAKKKNTGTDSGTLLPTDDDEKKSLTVGRYQFRKDGAGWECREIVGKGANRRRQNLAHLSREKYEDIQAKAKDREELAKSLIEWADEMKKEKRG